MSKHQSYSMLSSTVADALAATPNITHVRSARDGHSGVQFHCHLDDEPADVTIIAAANKPVPAVQAAYNATERDTAHLIVTRDERIGARVNRWLRASIANATDKGIQLYQRTEPVERDETVAVTAAETAVPEWWVRRTNADACRARVCKLRHDGQFLATYGFEHRTTRFEANNWIEIDRHERDKPPSAIAPITDHRTVPRPTTWHRITRPLTVPLAMSLTDSAVYALPEASGDGLIQMDTVSQRTNSEQAIDYEQTATVVNELFRQRTVASPTAAIGYDTFETLVASRLQVDDRPSKLLITEVLTNGDRVTIKRTAVDGQLQRQLDCAWAVPPSSD